MNDSTVGRTVVPVERIELPTFGLQNRCSTAELNRQGVLAPVYGGLVRGVNLGAGAHPGTPRNIPASFRSRFAPRQHRLKKQRGRQRAGPSFRERSAANDQYFATTGP